jgi:hypothetical protein
LFWVGSGLQDPDDLQDFLDEEADKVSVVCARPAPGVVPVWENGFSNDVRPGSQSVIMCNKGTVANLVDVRGFETYMHDFNPLDWCDESPVDLEVLWGKVVMRPENTYEDMEELPIMIISAVRNTPRASGWIFHRKKGGGWMWTHPEFDIGGPSHNRTHIRQTILKNMADRDFTTPRVVLVEGITNMDMMEILATRWPALHACKLSHGPGDLEETQSGVAPAGHRAGVYLLRPHQKTSGNLAYPAHGHAPNFDDPPLLREPRVVLDEDGFPLVYFGRSQRQAATGGKRQRIPRQGGPASRSSRA